MKTQQDNIPHCELPRKVETEVFETEDRFVRMYTPEFPMYQSMNSCPAQYGACYNNYVCIGFKFYPKDGRLIGECRGKTYCQAIGFVNAMAFRSGGSKIVFNQQEDGAFYSWITAALALWEKLDPDDYRYKSANPKAHEG